MIYGRALSRILFLAVLAGAAVVLLGFVRQFGPTHPHLVYLTGWSLLALMLILTAYNGRKKLPFLPLLSSRTWLQVHLYLGLFTGLLFLVHVRWHWPAGPFEAVLALLFVGVTVSGLIGWWISRVLPRRLTTAGGEVPFDRIPILRRTLREQAERLAVSGVATAQASTLAEFYAARLAEFFAARPRLLPHLVGSRRRVNNLIDELDEVGRFLNPEEKKNVDRLAELVRQRDVVDFHRAGGLVLKGWLFVHIPLTYGLLLFTAVHIVVVYAFSGGAR